MKVTGIAQGTLITTLKGDLCVENCSRDLQLLSKYDKENTWLSSPISTNSCIVSVEDTVYLLKVIDGRTIEVTDDCQFLCEDGKFCSLFNLPADISIATVDGTYVKVDHIVSKRQSMVYTVIMQERHTFIANGFIVASFDSYEKQ